jgi:hypothetical protein
MRGNFERGNDDKISWDSMGVIFFSFRVGKMTLWSTLRTGFTPEYEDHGRRRQERKTKRPRPRTKP